MHIHRITPIYLLLLATIAVAGATPVQAASCEATIDHVTSVQTQRAACPGAGAGLVSVSITDFTGSPFVRVCNPSGTLCASGCGIVFLEGVNDVKIQIEAMHVDDDLHMCIGSFGHVHVGSS